MDVVKGRDADLKVRAVIGFFLLAAAFGCGALVGWAVMVPRVAKAEETQREAERLVVRTNAEAAPLTVIADNWTQEDYRNLQYAVDQAAWNYISFDDDATRARHEAFSKLKDKLEVAKEAAWRVEHGQQVGK